MGAIDGTTAIAGIGTGIITVGIGTIIGDGMIETGTMTTVVDGGTEIGTMEEIGNVVGTMDGTMDGTGLRGMVGLHGAMTRRSGEHGSPSGTRRPLVAVIDGQ